MGNASRGTDRPHLVPCVSTPDECTEERMSNNARVHDFDAGALSCGTGLAAEVRRRLVAIPVGETLRVVTRDAAAREDIPALARLLGQRVLAVDAEGETTTITLERTR